MFISEYDMWVGSFLTTFLYVLIALLYVIIPGPVVHGYGYAAKQKIHLNGLRVYYVILTLCFTLVALQIVPANILYLHRWSMTITAFFIGMIFTVVIVFKEKPTGNGLLMDIYAGRIENPHYGTSDMKMYLYLVGGTVLELNVLSFVSHQGYYQGFISKDLLLYAFLFSFFVTEYLYHEHVHLYTFDFVAERVGFKLGWGCLVFYPFFYPIGAWYVAEIPTQDSPIWCLALNAIVFFTGWILSRGANNQKYLFKINRNAKFLGVLKPEAINNLVLCNGWWGLSRHINYLGEVLMASGLTLCCGWHILPWLYPLYYVALLGTRERVDNYICAVKYGDTWKEYCRRVPWRIIPYVY
jgi:protein-S-isoprenylcysteine O-methyltransferase Ste14